MWRSVMAFGGDFLDHGEGAFAGRATGAKGDREELGFQLGQFATHGAQLVYAFRRLRREELDGDMGIHLFNQMKNSRLPSPPVIGLSSQARTVRPSVLAQSRSLCSTSLYSAAARTMPPLPRLPGPTSNCGLTSSSRLPWGVSRAGSCGRIRVMEMKETSPRSNSKPPAGMASPRSAAVRARQLMPSSDVTAGSARSWLCNWPWPTSTPTTCFAPACSRQSVKPPVDWPTSRQALPATWRPVWASAPASLLPPRET